MQSTVSRRGQTVVPAAIRRRYGINGGTNLYWLDTGKEIRVFPLPKDIIGALYGCAKGKGLTEELLRSRRRDKELERRGW